MEQALTTGAGVRAATVSVAVEHDVAALQPLWRAAEQSLVTSPYQRFGFCAAYMDSLGRADGATPAIIVLRDAAGAPVFVLPLETTRAGPVTIARIIGRKHANFSVPLFAPDAFAGPDGVDVTAALSTAAHAAGIDLFYLPHVPLRWAGHDNPLARLPSRPSANAALRTRLDPDVDATLTRLRGASGLRKLRSKQRKLMETAPLSHMIARTDDERAAVLSAFLHQKAVWFARQNLPDAFAAPAARAFLDAISAEPTLFEWHALVHGEEIIATFGAALHQGRMSTSVNSYASGDVARHSPGEMLLRELIAAACRAGADTFDLGVGDAAYKRSWLDEDEPMVDVVFGVGVSGTMAAATAGLWLAAKASLKQSGLANRLRRLKPPA